MVVMIKNRSGAKSAIAEAELNNMKGFIADEGLRFEIETYGCQMNAHDSERLAGILASLGYTRAQEGEEADLIIFNTCCVRENAEQKIFGNVGALKRKKQKNKRLIVAVCGCMMQQREVADRLARTFPFVNIVFGTHSMANLPLMLYNALMLGEKSFDIAEEDMAFDTPALREPPPLCAVNIMQGCDNFCSYCIVPYVRGRERSRAADDIVAEVTALASAGYHEVMLLGQNVNSYGKGLPDKTDFAALLRRVAHETDIERIRFMTSHPKDVSDGLLEAMAEEKKICCQLHLPVQSGSSDVLRRMNRRYSREDYLALIDRVRRAVPGVFLSTDVIVGFPGETEEDFLQTMSLMESVRFDAAYTFVYSVRKGTRAAEFPDQIDEDTKQSRIVRLVALQNELTYKSNLACVGKKERILVESAAKRDKGHVCGRTDGGKMVNVRAEARLIGSFADVEIIEAKKTTLYGRLLP